MRIPPPSPPLQVPVGLSDSEKAEVLADSHEAQLQPLAEQSEAVITEMVN
jgi:hypothetical protein